MISVYKLIDGGEAVYVGMTGDPKGRLYRHKRKGTVSSDATMEIVATFEDWNAASALETDLIEALRPLLNKTNNCRSVTHPGALPTDEARKVWLSRCRDPIARMPGWTVNAAWCRFGPRNKRSAKQYAGIDHAYKRRAAQ